MNRNRKIIPVLIIVASLILVFLAGCTTTDAYTTVGDSISWRAQNYKSIIAYSNFVDKKTAHTMENALLNAVAKYGIDGYTWLDVFPPLREYETDEVFEKLEHMDIDMVVYLTLDDSDRYFGVSSFGDSVYTYTTGQALFTFTFFPLDMNEPILVTQINARGDEFSSWDMINSAAAKRAIKEYATAAGIEKLPTQVDEQQN
jgi:hypothetical protein